MRFAVGTKVKVITSRMHTLVANATYHVATAVADSGVDRFGRERREIQVLGIMQASKTVGGVMNGHDRVA
jgi:hypothetical protein